jgi:hypothetical protein
MAFINLGGIIFHWKQNRHVFNKWSALLMRLPRELDFDIEAEAKPYLIGKVTNYSIPRHLSVCSIGAPPPLSPQICYLSREREIPFICSS